MKQLELPSRFNITLLDCDSDSDTDGGDAHQGTITSNSRAGESNSRAGLEVFDTRRIQGIGYGVLEFLGVGTTLDIFQNIHILYLQYGVLTSSRYDILIFFPCGLG
ncbi:hypothetical protein Tco_0908583 [Tanacetum coccineum]|uniref:Uncharacterized protein n=1 Tax=Tanacetum coccineum TaxID=301880 RepID=A0ABQ5CPR0_9ASTR